MLASVRALSSAGERSLHTGEVVGSIPTAPTIAPCNPPRTRCCVRKALRTADSERVQPEFSTPTSRYLSRFGRWRAAKPPRSQPPYLSAARSQSLQAIRPLRAQSSVQTDRRAFDSGSDQRALINISRIVYCAAQCNRLRDWQIRQQKTLQPVPHGKPMLLVSGVAGEAW